MRSYLSLVPKYFSVHKKKSRLVITSVAISVALVTGIFSLLDMFLQFSRIQVIHDTGNYHLVVEDATDEERRVIESRIDVQNAGRWISFKDGSMGGSRVKLAALDECFARNMNITAAKGHYPVAENEIMLEWWAAENFRPPLEIGDNVKVFFADGLEKEFVISGIYHDLANTKASATPGVLLSIAGAKEVNAQKSSSYLVEFKSRVNIVEAEKAIKSSLNLADDRLARNERLLAVMGQSTNNAVAGLYATGAILFLIVLIAGVMMIYNTFNISVMERVRQFGLLRCIGASQAQIKKLVRKEGRYIALRAIPVGVLAGMLIAFLSSAILKFYNSSLFGDMPLFKLSAAGIGAGIITGYLTVMIASFLPAQKAASVSPVNAVTGSNDIRIPNKKKHGLPVGMFPAEIAMGINNAWVKKRTLFLMSSSIAISIIMFLGFQVFIDFLNTAMKTTKPYTPDITLISEQGIGRGLYKQLSELDGTKRVYGRMFGYVDAAFNADRLTDSYKESIGGVVVKGNGIFDPPEKSWLISYEANQFKWAKADLIAGGLSEEKLDQQNGIIAVALHLRNNISTETAKLQLGDKVYIKTPNGTKEMTVMGILRSVPFSSPKLAMTTFVTTEKLFAELTGESSFKAVDIQLERAGQEQTVSEIKSMLDSSISLLDASQKNVEANQAFFTMAVFVYGFVLLIALISVLNIINTMNTSVASKIRYLGVMRAIGMSTGQLEKMVLAEAGTYSLTGGIAGCILGIALQKMLIANLLSQFYISWKFPALQIGLILILISLLTIVSVKSPLKRIKAQSVSEVIGSL